MGTGDERSTRTTTETVDGVYDITCLDEPDGKRYRAFLFTGRTPTLVDAGPAGTIDALEEGIAKAGVEPERLVITHGDGDHVGGFDDVVAGDAVSGADQRGLAAGQFHLPPAVYSEDLDLAGESLGRLLEYEFEAVLVYHGSSVTADARAKLDRYVNFPGK